MMVPVRVDLYEWLTDGELRPVGVAEWGTRPKATSREWTLALWRFTRRWGEGRTLFYAMQLVQDGTVAGADFPELFKILSPANRLLALRSQPVSTGVVLRLDRSMETPKFDALLRDDELATLLTLRP